MTDQGETTSQHKMCVALELADLQRLLTKGLILLLDEEKTSLDQWRTLTAIGSNAAMSMSELADATCLPSATLTRTVDSLVDSALVFRLASKEDRRRITVYLSEFGRARLDQLDRMACGWEQSLSQEVGDDVAMALSNGVRDALTTLRKGSNQPRVSER